MGLNNFLIQIDANWCLPSSSGLAKYAIYEQLALVLFALITAYVFSKNISEKQPPSNTKRRNLLKNPKIYKIVKSKYFSFSIRFLSAAIFVFIIIAGLYGRKFTSITAGFTWVFWWTLLIFFVAFAGKIFCAICPWDFFANLVQFSWLHKKGKFSGFNLKWPKVLSNIYPAAIFFIILTWLELGFDITRDSYVTALLGLLMVGMAITFALVFEKRAFCRYACLVGRVSGLYSQIAPVELRKIDQDVCKNCKTKECITGTDTTTQCPTSEKPFLLNQNTYCTLCTECIRSCNKDNLTLFTRPVGDDLENVNKGKKDESILTYVMFILTFFHGISMTKIWFSWTGYFMNLFDVKYIVAFSFLMVLIIIVTYLVLKGMEKAISYFAGNAKIGINLAFTFIPITLGYHLAHNSMHLFVETTYLIPSVNDPMGYGWDLFNLAGYVPKPWINQDVLRYIQLGIIAFGFFLSVKTLRVRLDQITKDKDSKIKIYLGYLTILVLIGILAVWFIYQPMMMKSTGL